MPIQDFRQASWQALWTSLRILVFRAGPEDFPFDAGKGLSRACAALAIVVYALFWAVVMPPLPAAALGVATIASMSLVTRGTLTMRKVVSRYQQTFNALLVTNALLTLAMLPALLKLAPPIVQLFHDLQQHPELAQQPDKLPQLSGAASAALNLLGFWQLAVTARIFARATNSNVFGGVLLAVMVMLAISLLVLLISPLVGMLMI